MILAGGNPVIIGHGGGSGGGGGSAPGGATGTLQFNAGGGNFGGVTGSSVSGANVNLAGLVTITPSTDDIGLEIIQFGINDPAITITNSNDDFFQFYAWNGHVAFSASVDSTNTAFQFELVSGISTLTLTNDNTHVLSLSPDAAGFFNATPAAQQTVTGAKLPSDTVMASLLAALVAYGLIIDSTT